MPHILDALILTRCLLSDFLCYRTQQQKKNIYKKTKYQEKDRAAPKEILMMMREIR